MAVFCEYTGIDFENNTFPRVDLYSFQYDSPIEENLGELFAKYNDPYSDIAVLPQVGVQTSGGRFILDFLIIANGHKYAVECDGKEYHDYYHDLYRDGMLLAEGIVDDMIRFRGTDLTAFPYTCMLFLVKIIPGFLSEQQILAVETKARDERWDRQWRQDPEGEMFYNDIFTNDLADIKGDYLYSNDFVKITCRNNQIQRDYATFHQVPDWVKAYSFSKLNNITDCEDFVARYSKRNIEQQNYFFEQDSYESGDYETDDFETDECNGRDV